MARGISSRDFDKFSKAYVGGLKKSLEQAARRNPPRVQIQAGLEHVCWPQGNDTDGPS